MGVCVRREKHRKTIPRERDLLSHYKRESARERAQEREQERHLACLVKFKQATTSKHKRASHVCYDETPSLARYDQTLSPNTPSLPLDTHILV